jgi:LacI family transcriptional regulator
VRVALHVVKQRRERLSSLIREGGFLPIAEICRHLDVSEATARRDLVAVAADGQITRTRGGGLPNNGARSSSHSAHAPIGAGVDGIRGGLPDGAGALELATGHSSRLSATPVRATLQNIADKTGFAKTTISLSLRNHPKIPEATRRIVQAAAKELDYRPDPALSRIAEHRWRSRSASSGSTIAFITTDNQCMTEIPDAPAMEGAQARARELGYGFEHFRLESRGDPARLGSVLFHRGIRGVIVGQLLRHDFCDRFPWNLFSTVGCDTGPYRPPTHIVAPDTARALVHAWRRALKNGFKHIGMALFQKPHASGEFDRTCAALYCQSLLPPEVRRVPVLHVQPDDKAGFLMWVKQQRPELILGLSDMFYWWLREGGYQVPKDIGFVSLMVHPPAGTQPKIAGMDYNMGLVGQAAVEQLDILIRTNQIGIPTRPFALMIESSWVAGETLGNAMDRSGGRPTQDGRIPRAKGPIRTPASAASQA